MLTFIIRAMIYLGSALMVYNIYNYIRFSRNIRRSGDWEKETLLLGLPAVLLVLFLIGYLLVGFFGKPDLIVSGILFGGSIFVCIIVYVLRRITDRIMENEQLKAKLLATETTSKAKTEFLSNMSHEMRTPLNAILGLLRLMADDNSISPSARANLDRIGASARHLLTIINDVLDMGDIDSGKLTLREERFSFADLMMEINSTVSAACHDKNLDYNCERIGNIDDEFIGDGAKLRHLLMSVVDNAVKYTDTSGVIRCSVEQIAADDTTRTLRFIVQDNGIGMDPEFLTHVFEPFAREDFSNTNARSGSGLGLSIAKAIAEAMHGSLQIESKKGVGTTVTVTMTLGAAPQEPAADSEAEDAPELSLAGRRILVVEDIDLNAEILMDLLDMEGMVAERAENGQVAVDKFSGSETGYYDAILMDLRMPVMDGLEATRRIRALARPDAVKVPIIAVTANAFEEDVRNSLEAGMDAHLPKPADIELMCITLRRLIKAKS